MNYKSYKDLGNDVHANIHKLQGQGYDLVVGIPRSGMIPAYMIALLLNVDCLDINAFLNNARVSKGHTRQAAKRLNSAWDASKVLLVDDSLKTGGSMQEAVQEIRSRVPHEVTRLAIYVEKVNLDHVDLYFEVLPGPRIYQWNVFHHSLMSSACLELEGVLCAKPSERELQDEALYSAFLSDAAPLVLPTHRIHTILTRRPETARAQTERWLAQHRIEYERLEMYDATGGGQKAQLDSYTAHKASVYRVSVARLFIEKAADSARRIADLSGKPVLCLEEGEIMRPGMASVAKHGKQHLARIALRKCQRRFFLVMPDSATLAMRNVYTKLFR